MQFPDWISRQFIFRVLVLAGGIFIASTLGFKGACQHLLERENQQISNKTAVLSKPPVNLLNNAYLRFKSSAPFAVVFFLSKECPMCKNYRPLIQRLENEYGKSGLISMLALRTDVSEAADSAYFLQSEFSAGKAAVQIADYFGATVTPEVFVVDSTNTIIYKGAIDNWSYETGRHSQKATEHYLEEVLKKIVSGKIPEYSEKKAFGCFIE